jgi:diacylglycerol O-acyltransferase-1
MATLTNTATSTARAATPNSSSYRGPSTTTPDKANGSALRRPRDSKYRHVFATHSLTRTACLSEDAQQSPSFVGFRNLMILVLSTLLLPRLDPDAS